MKINNVRKSLQKQFDNLDTISDKLGDIMDECEDDGLCDMIDKISEAIDAILDTEFPDVFEYIENELLDNEEQ